MSNEETSDEETSEAVTLRLGVEVVKRLIAQRPPLLLVDRVISYRPGPTAEVRCLKHIGANEPVFAGHFPNLALWPGTYTMEGLGQTANVLAVIDALGHAAVDAGHRASDALDALRALDASLRLGRAPRGIAAALIDALAGAPPRVAMTAAFDVKLLEPVFAGQTLEYRVRRTHLVGEAARFDVEATSEGRPVARGSMVGAASARMPGGLG